MTCADCNESLILRRIILRGYADYNIETLEPSSLRIAIDKYTAYCTNCSKSYLTDVTKDKNNCPVKVELISI